LFILKKYISLNVQVSYDLWHLKPPINLFQRCFGGYILLHRLPLIVNRTATFKLLGWKVKLLPG